MSIIHSDPAEAVAVRYFSKLNSVLGPLTIGVAFSINSLKLAQEWALFFYLYPFYGGFFKERNTEISENTDQTISLH